MAEMWKEAKVLIYETGDPIDETGSDECGIFKTTGATWSGATPQGVNTVKVLGHMMARTTDERNTTNRIAAAKSAFNSMRKLLTRTQAPPWAVEAIMDIAHRGRTGSHMGSHSERRHHKHGNEATTAMACNGGTNIADASTTARKVG